MKQLLKYSLLLFFLGLLGMIAAPAIGMFSSRFYFDLTFAVGGISACIGIIGFIICLLKDLSDDKKPINNR